MASKEHSVRGELFRMGLAATAGAAAGYGGRALWKQLPAIMASMAAGQVGTVAGKVKDSAVEGVSRVAGEAGQNASRAASTSRGTAKQAASKGASSARSKGPSTARRTSTAARRISNSGSSAKSRARKPA